MTFKVLLANWWSPGSEGLATSLCLNGTALQKDNSTIHLNPQEQISLQYKIINVGAEAPSDTNVTYEWTTQFYMVD